jgi:hypothetical protein
MGILSSNADDLSMFKGWLDVLRLNETHLGALPLTILAPTNKVRG